MKACCLSVFYSPAVLLIALYEAVQLSPAEPATKSLTDTAVETVPIIQWAIGAPAANQSQGNWLRTS